MSGDIAGFLAARLDEDEARARAALEEWDDESARYEWEDLPDTSFAHARWHDPARVLREVEADRRLIAEHEAGLLDPRNAPDSWPALRFVIKLRAVIWSDHPEYLESWKP